MLHSIHKELAQPTAIHHAVKCHFTDPNKLNLVVSKGNVLAVYRIYTTATKKNPYPTARMELIHEFYMQGTITSISSIRTNTSVGLVGLDSLLLTFKDAKKDLTFKSEPIVRVDGQSRCAVLKFYQKHFAILPFRYDTGVIHEDDEIRKKIPYLPSFVVNEQEIDSSIKNVVDFKFLYGYVEPTLAILYEPLQTFAGRLAHRKDTMCLIVVSLNVFQKTYPVLYRVNGLPYNCTHIEAVPAPVGGLLVLSHNALIHIDQTHTPGFAALVNPFFDLESHFKPTPTEDDSIPVPVKNKPASVYIRFGKISNCKNLGISLDGARSTFLSPDIIFLTLRSGDCYQVELVGEEGAGKSWKRKRGGVKDIKITQLGINVSPPSEIVTMVDMNALTKPQTLGSLFEMDNLKYYSNYLFIASKVADAMLIQFIEPVDVVVAQQEETVMELDAEDELDADLYGDSLHQAVKSNPILFDDHLKFRVCDTLLVTGPLRSVALGQPAPLSAYEYAAEPTNTHLEIVACGGYDIHGSIVVLHQSIRPQILSSFTLGKVDDIWAIKPSKGKSKQQRHKYMLISTEHSTKVLLIGDEIEELENSGFYSEGPTVSVASVLKDRVIVQVYSGGILALTEDGVEIKDTPVTNKHNRIVSSAIVDPYIVNLMSTGEVIVWKVSSESKVPIKIGSIVYEYGISCVNVFYDDSPLQQFPTVKEYKSQRKQSSFETETREHDASVIIEEDDLYRHSAQDSKPPLDPDFDPEDMDLYGDSKPEESEFKLEDLEDTKTKMDVDESLKREVDPQHWCSVVDNRGTLRILSLPDLEEKFTFHEFHCGHRFVNDQLTYSSENADRGQFTGQIVEILAISLGADAHRASPYFIARTVKADIFIYRVITTAKFSLKDSDSRLAIQMIRIDHNHITREIQSYADSEGDKIVPVNENTETNIKKRRLIPYDKIGARSQQLYSGVVVTGKRPFWIMMASSGGQDVNNFTVLDGHEHRVLPPASLNSSNTIRVHPMVVDGGIDNFTPLHNINIPFGFAYVNEKQHFRLAQLPSHFTYDHEIPICKVPLGRSAHSIAYHIPSQTYVLSSSSRAVFQIDKARYMAAVAAGVIENGAELPDAEKKVSDIQDVIENREPGMFLPEINACQLELVSPVTWETVDIVKMGEGEQIISVAAVELSSKETTSGRKTYIAVGTGYMRSEDLPCRGRLLVYDIIDVVPDPNNPQTNHKLKPFFTKDEKNPVGALCAVNGYLLATIGTKVLMHAMEDGDLNGIAFLDVSIFVIGLSSVKNFVLISDIYKSVWFVAFQEDPPKMVLLGKDLYPVSAVSSQFIISETSLAMLVSDVDNNLHVMSYEPFAVQTQGGQKLLRRGEMNLGYEVESFARLRLRPRMLEGTVIPSMKMGVVGGTLDGGLCLIIPITEKIFKRLYGVYSRMVTHLDHHAGLNPRGFRQLTLPVKSIHAQTVVSGPPGPRGVLDGEMLYRFHKLSILHQRELAKSVGTKEDRIIDDLLELSISIMDYF